MTVEKSRPGLGTEPPHGAFLSPQSGKHVLVAQHTRGSASLVLQHQRSATLQREGLKPQAGRQPNLDELGLYQTGIQPPPAGSPATRWRC